MQSFINVVRCFLKCCFLLNIRICGLILSSSSPRWKPKVELVITSCLVYAAKAMYGGSDVVELTPANFDKNVMKSDELWLIEFYAPWCGHCQRLTPEWKKAATALKGVVKVAAVDADAHRDLGGRYQVQGFPTIKVFGLNKNSPTDYQGAREAQGIVDAALREASSMVKQKLSGKRGSGGGGSGGSGKKSDPADVVELTDANFDDLVLNSEDMWLVEFFAPWCGHCKNLAPHWEQAATELKGKFKLGAVDATVHTVKASRFGVRGYPTIKFFPGGKKDMDSAQDYDGGRTSSDIVNWALDKVKANLPPPEVYEVTSQEVLDTTCEGKQLCVVSVLPHILDCQSKCRNEYITMLKKLGDRFKEKGWGWLWAEGGSQPKLEESLEIGGFGYPAMAAFNSKKKVFSILRSSFDESGIREFLRNLGFGKGTIIPLRGLPKCDKTEPWDGKDGVMPEEEDIDLSDVVLDDIKDEL